MAMPPDGQSPWHHSSDRWTIRGPAGDTWAQIAVPAHRTSVEVLFPLIDSQWEFFTCIRIEVRDARVWWWHTSEDGVVELEWTRSTPAKAMLPKTSVRARNLFESPPDAPIIAELHVPGPGRVVVADSGGTSRIEIALGHCIAPSGAITAQLIDQHRALVTFWAVGSVASSPSSLP